MTKLKQFFRNRVVMSLTTIFMLVGAVALAGVVNIYINDGEVETSPVIDELENFGGSGGVFQTDWYKVGNRVTWIKSGQFADGSVNLMSFLNPVDYGKATSTSDTAYNATTHEVSTSTVMSLNIDVKGVSTSTTAIVCGGSSTATALPTYELFNLTLPTSTPGVFNNNQATTTDGLGVIGTGSATQILLTHDYDYFNCVATGTPATAGYWASTAKNGVIGSNNTFNAYWSVEVIKNLQ